MSDNFPKRLISNVAMIACVLFMPWWVTLIVMFLTCIAVPRFYEVVIYGIIIDALYSTSWGFYGFDYVWSVISALMLVSITIIKPWLTWDN